MKWGEARKIYCISGQRKGQAISVGGKQKAIFEGIWKPRELAK